MKNKFRKTIIAGLTTVLLVSSLTGCGNSKTIQTSNNSDLRVLNQAVMTNQVDYYAAYVGKDQGIFEKHGIDLQVTEYVAGIYTIDAIVNGTASVGMMADYATVNRLGNTLHATDLKIFSELYSGGVLNGGLYVAPEYVDDLGKLDGSTGFITQTGTVSDYYVIKSIDYLGLDEENQTLLNTDSAQTQLALVQQNAASAIYASGSTATKVEEYGWKQVATSEELGIQTGAYLLANKSFIDDNKDILSDYLAALQETVEFIHNNTDKAADIIVAKTGAAKEDVVANLEQVSLNVGISQGGYEHLTEINDWAFAHNRFKEAYDIKDFFDTRVLEIKHSDLITVK